MHKIAILDIIRFVILMLRIIFSYVGIDHFQITSLQCNIERNVNYVLYLPDYNYT